MVTEMDHMKHSHNVMYDDIDAIQMKLDIVENKVEEYDDVLDKLESNSRQKTLYFMVSVKVMVKCLMNARIN